MLLEITSPLAAAIIAAGTILSVAVGKLIEYIIGVRKAKREKAHVDIGQTVHLNQQIYEQLYALMSYTNADHVFIARLHNGGKFADGMPMEKFSITNEVFKPSSKSIQQDFQNVLVSRFTTMMFELFYSGEYCRAQYKDVAQIGFFRSLEEQYQVKSMYCFLLKNLDDSPIAFLSIGYAVKESELGEEQMQYVEHMKDRLLNLLTASYERYNKK